ncbi:uncharacterized protein LOC128555268 [Mercenaria mercenaria]|uniref:uncharacterized protein LOC128555268 n=1 Tax=Mercenaria mercenaria TaxID=6596 RepID=UPI00234EE519|nr:uncharacterized protein LOC128555268 [Mercenaria mercenaria]
MPDVVSVEIQRSLGGGREDRLKVTSLHDVFYKESKPCREIYLTADAGLGKTAFSKRLILTWCQAKQFINNEEKYFKSEAISTMSEFEFVFLLSLRDYSDECDIDDMIIKQIIPRLASTSVTISDLETILSKEKCLLILDGLDEWTHPVSVCKQGRSDIPHRKARKCTILTTTRPWKMSVIKLSSCQIEQKLELVGLNETSVQSLKRSVITLLCGKSDIEKHIQDFDRAVHDKSISDLEAIPLLLTYLLCLWCDDIDLGRSKSELYCQIIELLMKRTFEKYPDMQQARESSRSDIPQCVSGHVHCEKLYKLLKALGQLSFETLFSENKENTLVFKLSVAEKYLNPDYLKLSLLSGILTQSKVQEKITIQSPKVSFSHKTMQEYLCALYISCHSDSDIQKIVLQNCRSLQNILDMSTVFVFISGMNSKIISSISYELMSVISQDEITVEYRSTTSYDMFMRHPLKDIQDMYISCIKENPDNEDLRLSCQDVFFGYDFEQEKYFTRLKRLAIHNKNNMESINIDTLGGPSLHKIVDSCALVEPFNINKLYYYGRGEETVLIKLLNRSGQCVTVISSVQFGSWTSEMSKTLQNNALLQAVYIRLFKMSHDVLNGFLNYIVNRKTMTEIRIENLMCTEHRRSCTLSLDFRQHSDLRKLELHYTPKVSQLKVNSQVKYVALWDINLTEMLLPPEMVNIERVELWFVNMSASSFRDLVKVVEKLSHKVTVKIKRCEMRPETEAENVKQFIRSSQNFRVTEDVGSQFVFETI